MANDYFIDGDFSYAEMLDEGQATRILTGLRAAAARTTDSGVAAVLAGKITELSEWLDELHAAAAAESADDAAIEHAFEVVSDHHLLRL